MSDSEKHPLIFGQHLNPTGQVLTLEGDLDIHPTITGPAWEPIGDHHKRGLPRVLAVHQITPHEPRLVRWGRISGQGVWVGYDGRTYYDADIFTHAYIVPPFEP